MKKIGLFYATNTIKTANIAKKIKEAFGTGVQIDIIPIQDAWKKDFESYDNLIVGASTWFDGELPTYWDELLPEISDLKFKNKTIAIFGLGDQVNYSDNFVDGIGILAELFESAGAKIVGATSIEGYNFQKSRAVKDNKFVGLAIDMENQADKTAARIKGWVEGLKKEFS